MDQQSISPLELVPSQSEPGTYHVIDPVARTCDCKGFAYRGRCRHLAALVPAAPAELLPCTGCRLYHGSDAERRQAHPDENPAPRSFDPGAAWLRAVAG